MKRSEVIKNDQSSGKKRYVIYTRCSTDEQAQGDFTTLDAQAHHCKNMLDASDHELADFGKNGIVYDDGYSGKDLNRPGIQSILTQIQQKKFDGIIFFRLDRLTRNPRDLYGMIDLFKAHDIDFVSVREKLDSSTAIGRVVIGIIGLLSAFERELTGERVRASAMARARQGRRCGGIVPIGYKLIKEGPALPNGKQPTRVIVDESTAPHIKIVWHMAASNKSQREIAEELIRRGVSTRRKIMWRKQAVAQIIKNPFYKGYIQYCGEMHRGVHDPLVTEKIWEKANKMMSANTPGRRNWGKQIDYTFLLPGLLKCGNCGSHLVNIHSGGRGHKKFFYYECGRSRQGLGCSFKRIPGAVFDTAIINYFKRASEDQGVVIRAISDALREAEIKFEKIDTQLAEKQDRLNSLRHEVENLLNLAMKNMISQGGTFKNKMAAMENEIETLEEQIKSLHDERKIAELGACSGQHLHQNIKTVMQHIDKAKPELQKNLLRALIQNIIVHDNKIVMYLYIQPENLLDVINEKSPIPNEQNGALNHQPEENVAPEASVSQWRQLWGE